MPATGDPVLQEIFPTSRLVEVIRERRGCGGERSYPARSVFPFPPNRSSSTSQDADYRPGHRVVRKKLDRLLSEAVTYAVDAYQEHVTGGPDMAGLFRLVFRLLAAKLLDDRGHPGRWAQGEASDIVDRVERYYYGDQPIPPAVSHPEVQRAVS